jgi:hypothetical protein
MIWRGTHLAGEVQLNGFDANILWSLHVEEECNGGGGWMDGGVEVKSGVATGGMR